MTETLSANEIQQQAIALRASLNSIQLATISSDGHANISYTPCVTDEQGASYIFISELAVHTKNLCQNTSLSIMWIEDELACRNLFARKRLSMSATASEVEIGSQQHREILDLMQSRLGNTLAVLRQLPDFHLFRLDAVNGSYVAGFAQAYPIRGNRLEVSV